MEVRGGRYYYPGPSREGVDSVNGQTGTVVLDADDIPSNGTTNQFVTSSDKTSWNNKSTVSVNQIKNSGEKIAEITVDGNKTDVYASAGSGSGVPAGGTTGQVLTKQSNDDGDADWETPSAGTTYSAGTGIDIDSSDNINLLPPTSDAIGGVKAGTGVSIASDGTISASGGGGSYDYSTTPQPTGRKWTDGKDVYECTYTGLNVHYGNNVWVDTTIPIPSNAEKLIKAFVLGSDDWPNYTGVFPVFAAFNTTSGNIEFYSGFSNGYVNEVIIEYTVSSGA